MIHGISAEEIIEKSENSVLLKVRIDAESDYFDGHFPDFKLLPAVAQIDLLLHYARKYFGLALSTPSIKRFKFSDKILPDALVLFRITFTPENSRVVFDISDFLTKKSYSSGTYTAKRA